MIHNLPLLQTIFDPASEQMSVRIFKICNVLYFFTLLRKSKTYFSKFQLRQIFLCNFWLSYHLVYRCFICTLYVFTILYKQCSYLLKLDLTRIIEIFTKFVKGTVAFFHSLLSRINIYDLVVFILVKDTLAQFHS